MQTWELRARPDQAPISISDGGDVCQAYTDNKGEKQLLTSNDKNWSHWAIIFTNMRIELQYNTLQNILKICMQSIIFLES